jgi:2C-methyl-D-erythritol 2,4-cyclodiphosphate synthase
VELTKEEISKRLQDLRNSQVLHEKARDRVKGLEKENKTLKEKIKEKDQEISELKEILESRNYELEQIKIKLFGKKSELHIMKKKEKKIRDISSYLRPVPTNITETKPHPISECAHCHLKLGKKWTKIFYEEDIPLPIEKTVIKHEVEVGYCKSCKKQSSGMLIPSKKVVLGENVKKYVCILSIVNRLSHTQIEEHLEDVWSLPISTGEIGNILETEADGLRPEYQALKESVINQLGTHYDETSWKVQKEEQGKFAWVATGTENNDTVFSLGKSRGKGNIENIGKAKLGITDDYAAYRNSFENHQLCWAHPYRKIRDLAESREFTEESEKVIMKTYNDFGNLYHKIQKLLQTEISQYLQKKFQDTFTEMTESNTLDPTPLAKIKEALRRNQEKYFTFLKHRGIPIDNNKAERVLRHLVIKRRTSFGSKTQRGAETTSILASVILSLKWNRPHDWFQRYLKLGS